MADYVQIRCDVNNYDKGCWEGTDGTWKVGPARKQARQEGWKVDGRGFAVCPACQK